MDKVRSTRAVFLPSPSDPFVLLHCIHYFETVWQDEVDKIYICINSNIEQLVVFELMKLLKHPKMVVSYYPMTLGHGKALSLMLEQCEEDSILFIEDDSIIFKKGIVDEYFRIIESGKRIAIGSPRMSCPKEVAVKARKDYDLNYEGFGDRGAVFWPCFLFIPTRVLRLINIATNYNLGASDKGDTFALASLEIREYSQALSGSQELIEEIPQYHLSPDDEQHKERNLSVFNDKCGYMHFGSLSSGIENTLLDDDDKPLKDRHNPKCGAVKLTKKDGMEKLELERRVMWWNECYRLNQDKFGEFGDLYGKAIEKVIEKCGLSRENINNMRKMYMEVINEN